MFLSGKPVNAGDLFQARLGPSDLFCMLAGQSTPPAWHRSRDGTIPANHRMANSPATPAPPSPEDAALPSEGIRTAVSFLVFVHLFALLIGILSNEVPSQLEQALAGLPVLRQYRQALGMDLPYTYYFTRGNDPGGELDIDYTITATVNRPDGEKEVVELPAAGTWPRQRFHRYQMLATRLATFASEGAPEPANLEMLARAIAGGILRREEAQSLDLLCRGQLTPPAMEEFRPELQGRPGTRDAYDAHVFLAGDRVELLKKEPARDTAPPPKN